MQTQKFQLPRGASASLLWPTPITSFGWYEDMWRNSYNLPVSYVNACCCNLLVTSGVPISFLSKIQPHYLLHKRDYNHGVVI